MEKIKYSSGLKITSYILIPILVALIICCTMYTVFMYEKPELNSGKGYFETEMFADSYFEYLNTVVQKVNKCTDNEARRSNYYREIKPEEGVIYLDNNNGYKFDTINYIIKDNVTNAIYTNIEVTGLTDTLEELKSSIKSDYKYWNSENENIQTNINKLEYEEIKYAYSYETNMLEALNINDYTIYTSVDNDLTIYNNLYKEKLLYDVYSTMGYSPIAILVIATILLIAIGIYLIYAIGYKKGIDGIHLNFIDNIPLEIILVLLAIALTVSFSGLENFVVFAICYIVGYIACAISGITIIKRIKAKTLFKNTLTYKIYKWIKNIIKKIYDKIFDNIDRNIKVIVIIIAFILASIILCKIGGLGIILAIALWVYGIVKVINVLDEYVIIEKALKDIYEGKEINVLYEGKFIKEFRDIVKYINDISSGFSNAVEESLKSERLKTELITNVSHDIKTPLTSIINYVDLLKSEEIESEKAKEYIEILDGKSQRLKKLIEDLVEASKVSSGNIKLEKEKLDVSELIKQTTGEFEDKFKTKNLEIITAFPENELCINADSRYLYRVIENLFSNISKYALENSRVYIDIIESNGKVKIQIKNISKERLNISSEELMQRFVRGDKSRTTEGSGLGLSISKSLVELQEGEFNIAIDGDLFKVEMEFRLINIKNP